MLAVGLTGCASPRTVPLATNPPPHAQVRYQAVTDKHLKHYRIAPSQSAIAPDPKPDNPVPVYPQELVAAALPPVNVTALLIVDAKGRVRDMRIASEATDDAVHKRFDAAVRAATQQWRFTPMRIANWVKDAQGNEHRVSTDAKPFSQAYRFHFEIHNGKPQVSSELPAAQR